MGKEDLNEFKDNVKDLIDTNHEEGVYLLKHVCFYGNNCDIRRCRSPDYNKDRGTGTCCEHYEDKCKLTLNSLLGKK